MDFPSPLLDQLRRARHVVVFTGAGVSAESGIPTFRDALSGLWSQYRAEDLATPEAFQHHPQRVWEWYASRREKVETVQPNPAHHAIAALASRVPRLTLVTQNVDGLHQQAGSADALELHGNIRRVKCFARHHRVEDWRTLSGSPPACPQCGSLLRPDVVWFGEMLPEATLEAARQAARNCDLLLSVGTSSLVYPAAELPYLAARGGAAVVQVNPAPTPLDETASFNLLGKAGEVLPALLAAAWPSRS